MPCILHIYGTDLRADLFLNEASFAPEQILHNGALDSSGAADSRLDETGLSATHLIIEVSKADALSHQVEDAVMFLKLHLDEIKRLRDRYDAEEICLNFTAEQPQIQLQKPFPSELSNLALNSGMNLNIFEPTNSCSLFRD